jgi:hypothetical protein
MADRLVDRDVGGGMADRLSGVSQGWYIAIRVCGLDVRFRENRLGDIVVALMTGREEGKGTMHEPMSVAKGWDIRR